MVKAEAITPRSISRILELTGEVAAVNTVTIAATLEGPIAFNPWREGDRVERGQKLIEIDRPAYREEVQGALASLQVAQARLDDLRAGTRPEEIAQAAETVTKLEEALKFCKVDLARVTTLVQRGGLPGEALDRARLTWVDLQCQHATGMFARMRVVLEALNQAVVVPVEAVLVTPQGDQVAVVIQDGKAVQRTVTTGIEQDRFVQVQAGLAPGVGLWSRGKTA
jgi:multidrug efflux pump subunit AcrA (membrane-fusion protein)